MKPLAYHRHVRDEKLAELSVSSLFRADNYTFVNAISLIKCGTNEIKQRTTEMNFIN